MLQQSDMVGKVEYEHKRANKIIGKGFTEKYFTGIVKTYYVNFLTREVTEDIIYPGTNKKVTKKSSNFLKYLYLRFKLLLK